MIIKNNVKEMECKRKEKNARDIKCMKEIENKMQRGVQAVIWGV